MTVQSWPVLRPGVRRPQVPFANAFRPGLQHVSVCMLLAVSVMLCIPHAVL